MAEDMTAMWGEWKDELERFEDEQRQLPEPPDWDRIERQHEAQRMMEWEREQDED